MGKALKKARKRLNARQERWQVMVAKMNDDQKQAYKKPGSNNAHKGS
jgi:hypothetical protein